MSDPNLHWDGTRWLHWDGHQWVDATTGSALATPPSDPAVPTSPPAYAPENEPLPPPLSRTWIGIAIGALAAVLVVAIGVVLFLVLRPKTPAPVATPSPTPPATSTSPTASPTTYTLYFVNPDFPGGVYGAGVKTRGNQASGWVGTMQSGDIGCFNGTYSGGVLTGTMVIPPDGGGGAPAAQPFTWPVSGAGENFRLVAIGDVTPLREVPLATINDYAAKPVTESWQPLFSNCAKLTGGLE